MNHLTSGLLTTVFIGTLSLFGPPGASAQEAAPPVEAPAISAPPVPAQPPAPSPLLVPPPPPPPAPVNIQAAPAAVPPAGYRARSRSEYDGPPLLLGGHAAIGGFGGPSVAYTNMLNRDGALVGFEGALLLAHRLSIGLAGYGFTRSPAGPAAADGSARNFGAGYGGVVVRYAFLTQWPVYPSLGLLVGGGAVVLHREFDDVDHDHHNDNDRDDQGDGFFVAQPELSLHANLTRWMRLGATVGYRVTSGVHRFNLTESDLNGVVLGGNLQFGWL